LAPGQGVPFFPKDANFQRHVWAGLEASDLSPGQVCEVVALPSACFLFCSCYFIFAPRNAPNLPILIRFCFDSFHVQVAYSNILGFALLTLVASKLTTLFSGKEGTYLRRNLLIVFGAMDIVMATSLLRFERGFKVSGASIKGLCLLTFTEGAVFLYDAFVRPRPRKPSSSAKDKGQ